MRDHVAADNGAEPAWTRRKVAFAGRGLKRSALCQSEGTELMKVISWRGAVFTAVEAGE